MAAARRSPSPFTANRKRKQSCDMGILHGDPLSPVDNSDFTAKIRTIPAVEKPQNDPRSKHKYNVLSRLLFFWLEPLFFLGARQELDQEDMYVHPTETDSKKLLTVFNRHWSAELNRKKEGKSARLWVALLLSILWRFILQGILILIEAGILLYQSVILGQLSEYFTNDPESGMDMKKAYLLAFGLVMLSLVVVIMHSHSFLMGQKMSMILRVISTAAIYQKILSLTQVTIGRLSVGHIVNLASNDVQRFDPVFPHLPYMWVSPLHLIVFTYLAYQEVGWSAFLATGFILLQVPLQILFARLFIKFRIESAELTDKRIHIMNEVISGIRVIKMYAWEAAFKNVVSKLRKKESIIIFKGAIIRACNLAYMIISTSIVMWLVLTVHTSTGGTLTTRQTFTVLSLLTSLRLSSYFFVLGLLGYSEGRVALRRIEKFLLTEEFDSASLSKQKKRTKSMKRNRKSDKDVLLKSKASLDYSLSPNLVLGKWKPIPKIQVSQLSASWNGTEDKLVLQDITFEVNKTSPFLAVIGPVGAGKSSLLHCIIRELPALRGSINVQGSISYVSQNPWVFAGTVKENILFGKPYNSTLYRKVIEACSLDEDFEEFPSKDLTVVGERGVTLSGGQKARINLARAIYRDGDILLLDDPLSALDVNVAAYIYDKCIHEVLENKLVILVTHQIHYAVKAHKILLIREGHQEVYNSHSELLSEGLDLAYLIGLVHEDEEDDDERRMYSYKRIDDPPSPTIVSMLSTDPFDEGNSMAPVQEIPTGDKGPAITPLALFSKAVRENLPLGKPYTGTCDIVVKRKPRLFVFPLTEENSCDENEDGKSDGEESDVDDGQCRVGWENQGVQKGSVHNSVPMCDSNPLIFANSNILEPNSSWPFAGQPPGISKTQTQDAKESSNTNLSMWPFANKPPGKDTTTGFRQSPLPHRKQSICSIPLSPSHNRKQSVCSIPISIHITSAEEDSDSDVALDEPKSHRIIPPPLSVLREQQSPYSDSSLSPIEQEDNSSKTSFYNKGFNSPPMDLLTPTFLSTPKLPNRYNHNHSPTLKGRNSSLSMQSALSRNLDEQYQLDIQPSHFDTVSMFSIRSKVSVKTNEVFHGTSDLKEEAKEQAGESRRSGTVSVKTYYKFFTAGANIFILGLCLLLLLLGEVAIVVSDWWLSDWAGCFSTENSSATYGMNQYCSLSNMQRVYVYTVTTTTAVCLNFTRVITFCFICIHASMVLHNNMFKSVLGTKMLFFDKNPIGRILNRFSKDVSFLDDLLPFNFCEFLLLSLRCMAIVFTATASNPWLIIPALAMTVLFIVLRWYYLKSARDVKRLESIARSPVYSHLSSTLQGLCTIKSYEQEQIALQKLHTLQNEHSQVWYLYLVMIRWFGIRVDILSVFFLASVAFISIPLATGLNAGLVGLSLTYTISLADMLQYTIRLSAEVENTMISAERVLDYGSLESEEAIRASKKTYKDPPKDWPSKGEIKMEGVTFRYEKDQPQVLSNLHFTVNASEKVGIVGRTGAGKSSLISVLYRMNEPEGKITIDGMDTSSISLHHLREKMSIIPQEPLLFSGTVRYNLDPFEEYSDLELWEALEQVQLKSTVQQMDGQLSGEVTEGGSNFSVGQRQLVCLARALLRKNKIIILDEATANVDPRTDGIIQKAIQDSFSECTVLVIAHRLNTIMDSDKLMFLKNGTVMEYDSPYKLLQDPNSHFYLMVEKTGDTASGSLHQIALESHLQRMFKKSGRLCPAKAKFGVKNMSHLFAKSLLQRSSGSGPFGLSRLQERRASMLSSNSFPCALNEIGKTEEEQEDSSNSNNNISRIPSDPHVSASSGSNLNTSVYSP